MCVWVETETEALTGVDELIAQGWEVRDEDIYDGRTVAEEMEFCLCGVDVERVLERTGLPFWHTPVGFTLTKPKHREDIAFDRARRSQPQTEPGVRP